MGKGKRERQKRKAKKEKQQLEGAELIVDVIRYKINEHTFNDKALFKSIIEGYDLQFQKKHLDVVFKLDIANNRELIAKKLFDVFEEIESEIQRLLSKHSLHYWYLLESRIPHATTYSRDRGTIALYKRTMRAAILKYSNSDFSDVYINENEQILPKEIKKEDIADLYRVDRLSFSLYMATADLRNYWKGGKLKIEHGVGSHYWQHSKEIENCIDWMDKRSNSSDNAFHQSGIYMPFRLADFGKKEGAFFSPFPIICMPSYDGEFKWSMHPLYKKYFSIENEEQFPANYILFPFDFVQLEQSIRSFEPFFKKEFGFTVSDFIFILISVSYRFFRMAEVSGSHVAQLAMRGNVKVSNRNKLIIDLVEICIKLENDLDDFVLSSKVSKNELVTKVLDIFTFNPKEKGARAQVDLLSRRGLFWIIDTGDDGVILDLRNFTFALDDFFYNCLISASGKVQNRVTDSFPRISLDSILSSVEKAEFVWHANKELESADGQLRECDLAFKVQDILFVAECKARRSDSKKSSGRFYKMDTVWGQAKKDFHEQANTLALFIKANKSSLNIKIPEDVKFICPLVVYPNITWLASESRPYKFSNELPRMCTPEELIKVLRNDNMINSFRSDPWTLEVGVN
jgi:hypothetical protein